MRECTLKFLFKVVLVASLRTTVRTMTQNVIGETL